MAEPDPTRREPGIRDAAEMNPYRVTLSRPVIAVLVLLCLLILVPNALFWLMLDQWRSQRNKEELFWLLCHPGYASEQRSQAFSELLWHGNREWRSARLERLDLTGAQLAAADVQQAHLEGCKLAGADLTGALLRQTQLDQADLSGADLSGANLFECDLLKADLRGATLAGADLRGADIGQSNASAAKFVSADMKAARCVLALLTGADLRMADLAEANLSLTDMRSANLIGTNLADADLREADLRNANWWRAVGLTPDQVTEFKKLYPPSDDASESLKQDYQKWLAESSQAQRADDR